MTSETNALVEKYYSSRAGWLDGTSEFLGMIETRLERHAAVLDVGAGSGRGYKYHLRGRVARLVGVDLSPEVLQNPFLDEAFCCNADHLPFRDEEYTHVFSDYVFEHLSDPARVISEIYRVLKPGGCFFLRTPNQWHYVPLIASVLPETLQVRLLERMTTRNANDIFPKFYRCNTEREVKRTFTRAGFSVEKLVLVEKEPVYLLRRPVLFRIGVVYERLVNSSELFRHLRSNILGIFQKPHRQTQGFVLPTRPTQQVSQLAL